jgi:phosphoribosylformimino-5-aminoimidazole carboxamide ribotide isomerase
VERGAWSVERGAWSVERGAWSVERGAWSVERGAWSVERGAWSVEPPASGPRLANPRFMWHIASLRKSCCGKDKGILLMQIWPAIDLRGGKCVRLRQGDYRQETVYGEDPAAMARRWVDAGARQLHLVDLDGARDGSLANRAAIVAILGEVQAPCQLGGGIRDEATMIDLFALGLQRLVIGTQALKRPTWFRDMCRKFPHQLVVGIDARDGRVATDGWLETSQVEATTLAERFAEERIAGIVYTDIARDGMMEGPNLKAMAEMASAVAVPVIASGGVTTAEDVRRLASTGVAGCIIGRSLYEGSLTLSDALAAAGLQ